MTTVPTRPDAASLAVLRARLATLSGRRKRDLLLDAPDPKSLVRSLPAEDLYFAVRDIGLEDSVEIIQLASPSQFRSFVDLDAWEGDLPDTERALLWLRLAFEGANGPEDFRKKRAALDIELIVLLLKTQTVVHQLEEGVDPVLTSDNWLYTAERKYLVEISAEGDDGVTIRKLLEDFIDENPFEATRLFEAVRWEMQSELEENCKRWRDGRVRELGFPDFEEAIRLWQPMPPDWNLSHLPAEAGRLHGVPLLLAMRGPGRLFLDEVIDRLDDEDRGRFNEGYVYLLNCALVADGIQPRDFELARSSVLAARERLSFGLEFATKGDAPGAANLLATTPATDLFRIGVAPMLFVQSEAGKLWRLLAFPGTTSTLLDSPDVERLRGLMRKRPVIYDPPASGEPARDAYRPFRELRDVELSASHLERGRASVVLLRLLGHTPASVVPVAEAAGRAVSAVTLSQLGMSRMVLTLLGQPKGDVLTPDQLAEVAGWFEAGRLRVEMLARLEVMADSLVRAAPAPTGEHAKGLVAGWLAKFEEELGPPASAGPLDPRFIDVLLVAPA